MGRERSRPRDLGRDLLLPLRADHMYEVHTTGFLDGLASFLPGKSGLAIMVSDLANSALSVRIEISCEQLIAWARMCRTSQRGEGDPEGALYVEPNPLQVENGKGRS